MNTVQISKENALKAYNEGCSDVKKVLSNLFGKEFFTPKNIIDRVKSFEDACAITGEDPNDVKFTSGKPHRIALEKLEVIAHALRNGVVLSYANSNQKKWYPYFVWDQSGGGGFRFYGTGYVFTYSFTHVGSRLCVDTEEKAKYLGTHFISLYNAMLE
jgi:hypothetical protein